jgi:peptide/nickel transport system ATP-binding protein
MHRQSDDILLDVRGLKKHFPILGGVFRRPIGWIKAVDGVDFFIRKGETLGLVGESGCGKTTTGKCVLYLEEPTGGEIRFNSNGTWTTCPNAQFQDSVGRCRSYSKILTHP